MQTLHWPLDNGKPTARRGRKATGLQEAAGLPKEDPMNKTNRTLSCLMLLAAPLLSACEQVDPDAGAAVSSGLNGAHGLGVCAPAETTGACETACSRIAACASDAWAEEDHWGCTQQCVQEVFRDEPIAMDQVACLGRSGGACTDVSACLATVQTTPTSSSEPLPGAGDDAGAPSLPYGSDTEDYCEMIANSFAECGAWEESQWTPEHFVTVCTTWGNGFKRNTARCALKYHGTCHQVTGCFALP